MTDTRHHRHDLMRAYRHHLMRALANLALAIFLVLAVIAVSALTVQLLEKPKLKSQCPGLIETWQAHGLPAHLEIKCREYLK